MIVFRRREVPKKRRSRRIPGLVSLFVIKHGTCQPCRHGERGPADRAGFDFGAGRDVGCDKPARSRSARLGKMTVILPDSPLDSAAPRQPAPTSDEFRARAIAHSPGSPTFPGNLPFSSSINQVEAALRKAARRMPTKEAERDVSLITLHGARVRTISGSVTTRERVGRSINSKRTGQRSHV